MAQVTGERAERATPASSWRMSLAATLGRWRDELRLAWSDPQVRRGFLGMCLIGAGSLSPAFLPPDAPLLDTLHLSWVTLAPVRLAMTLLLIGGVALLLLAWLRLRPGPGKPTAPVLTWALWSVPVLFAPPLFSRDAYSYAAQGLIVARGMDPYGTGPISVPGPYADQVDNMWLYTAAPYGPLSLQVQHLIVLLTRDNAYVAAVAMRLPALLSVALIAYALPRLAERVGVSRQQAVWLGVLNPLVMMHLVGGMHGDAMMIALVVYGLLLASHGHLALGSMSIAAGATFKQTAVLALIGVAALALRARRRGPLTHRAYLLGCLASGTIALVTFELITLATGLGWGWVPNLSVPTMLRSLLSPPTLIGSLIEWSMVALGMPKVWTQVPVPFVQSIGFLIGLAVMAYLALRVAPRRPVTAAAGAFLALCLGGPVIHPWYMLWGGVLLGAARLTRRSAQLVVWVTMFFVGYSAIDAAFSNGVWALGLTAVAWTIWRIRGPREDVVEWHATGAVAANRARIAEAGLHQLR